MDVHITRVSGSLAKPRRSALERAVGKRVSEYFDAAFLAGDYPRTDFDDAFASFSRGAAKKAERDRELLTNVEVGESTDSVTPKQKKVSLSVLTANRTAVGVTAHIRLVFVVDARGSGQLKVTRSGRLLLAPKKAGGWEIFGYDLARSSVPMNSR